MYVEDLYAIGQYLDDLSEANDRPFNFDLPFEEDAGGREVANFFW